MWSFFFRQNKKKGSPARKPLMTQGSPEHQDKQPLGHSLAQNQKALEQIFTKCNDVVYRELVIGEDKVASLIVFMHGLSNERSISEQILKSLMEIQCVETSNNNYLLKIIKKAFLEVGDIKEVITFADVVNAILIGDTVLLVDGTAKALQIGTRGWETRSVSEPVTEGVVRGPREGFTETLRINTALLRRKIKSSQLKLEKYILGRATKTEINLAYLEGTVNEKVVQEVKKRIERIDVDSILESAYIEELIEDESYTLFPQMEHSERPDKVAAAILEGRVAILIDGTPFALMVPTLFVQFFQSSEDYYERYPFPIMVRMIRYLFVLVALFLPPAYIAITTYHHEMLPTSLLLSIAGAHRGVPFPAFVEALLMEITFEVLREAGVRLPRPVGQAVSIVGALVIGEAAVQAGIVSPAMVIVVALTGISSFSIPAFNLAIAVRMLRFIMMILGATLGFYGIALGGLFLMFHLTSLRSFGVPYMAPLAPFKLQDLKDVLVRAPWWAMTNRPSFIGMNNRQRQKFNQKPQPPKNNDD